MTTSLPAQLVRTRRFTLGGPEQFTVAKGGSAVLFLRSRAGDDPVNCLWLLDLDSGTERVLADPAELLTHAAQPHVNGEHEPLGAGIASYATDSVARSVVFELAGNLWVVTTDRGAVRQLPIDGRATDPRLDPGGHQIAYLCDGELRLVAAEGGGDHALAVPDGPDVTFGIAEHTGDPVLGGPRGFWWAPAGDGILAVRADSTAVPQWHISDPANPGSKPRTVRYAGVGAANVDLTLWIFSLDGSPTEVAWDRRKFEYVVAAGWDDHGPYAVVQSRDQRNVRFLGIDPADGTTTVLDEAHDDCWVQLVPGLPVRTTSGAVVSHADIDGTRHLSVDGRPVTPAGLQLRAVLGVDGDDVLFGAADDPTATYLWTYRVGDGVRQLSDEPGVHTGVRRDGTLVRVVRGPDQPGNRVDVIREGNPVAPVASHVERPVLDLRVAQLVLGSRELRAALFLPSWHQRGHGSLPVLVDSYGGAGLQRVTTELDWRSLVSQWFAEQGFAVLVTDGSGTAGRGPVWEREVCGDLFGPVLNDQVTALHEAARLYPELDLTRVGIRGWSFGGSLAAVAVLRRPDVFHVAVAGAGVTDQLLYNAHWRERFLGHPAEFPERYEAGSLLHDAPKLRRPLLLIHGLADDNVFPANTLRLSHALLAAGRSHEVLLLSGIGHQAMQAPITEGLLSQQIQFLRRHLRDACADLGDESDARQ